MADVEQRMHLLTDHMIPFKTENTYLHSQNVDLARQQAETIPDLMTALTKTVEAQNTRGSKDDLPTLVDMKGIGKPPISDNTEASFTHWHKNFLDFAEGVFPDVIHVSEEAVEEEAAIPLADFLDRFAGDVPNLPHKLAQIRVALSVFTTGESYGMIGSCQRGNGAEA